MKKVFSHFLRHKFVFVVIVALLVLQATCDLSLPTYTADIVNTGIARSGIGASVPLHLSAASYDRLVAVAGLTESETAVSFVKGAYTEINGVYEYSHIKDANGKINRDEDTARLKTLAEYLAEPMLFMLDISAHPEIVEQAESSLAAKENTSADADAFDIKELALLKEVTNALSDPARAETVNLPAAKARFTKFSQSLSAVIPSQVLEQIDIAYIRDEYTSLGIDTGKMQNDYVMNSGFKMICFALLSCFSTVAVTFLSARMGAGFGHDLRSDMFRTVLTFSGREYNKFSTASLITRCTNDIQQVQLVFVMMVRMSIYSPIMAVSAFVKVLHNDYSMSWIIGVAVGAVLVIVGTLFSLAIPRFKMIQKLIDRVNLISREILEGLPVIRAFAREKYEENRFDKANGELYGTQLFVSRAMATMMPLMMFLMNGVAVLIIWTGAKYVAAGTTQVGNLMAFMTYAVQIIVAFMMLSMMSVILPRSIISLSRVGEVLETKSMILDPAAPAVPDGSNAGRLVFDHVNFKYDGADENALEDITFTVNPGTTTAIIGSTGSGKSTLINLIPRFFDVTGGSILFGGTDLRDLPQEYLRERIGYVPQRAILFSGTVESNIRFAEGVTQEQMYAAAGVAQAEEFINSDPDKYARAISQGGTNVSGGQKQRLSIARAVAKNPDVYIFDDSFSALDFKTDVTLRAQLHEHINTNNPAASVIVVAQRISTVLRADNIIVLEDGKIAGQGTHGELMETCAVYRQIALSQLTQQQLTERVTA